MSNGSAPRRPFLISLLGVLGILQAVVGAIGGIALIAERDDPQLIDHTDVSSTTLLWTGIGALIVAGVTLVVAIGLLRGVDWARLVLGVVQLFHLGGGLYVLIAYAGVQRWDGLVAILIALLILWILFGSRRSQEFFAAGAAR